MKEKKESIIELAKKLLDAIISNDKDQVKDCIILLKKQDISVTDNLFLGINSDSMQDELLGYIEQKISELLLEKKIVQPPTIEILEILFQNANLSEPVHPNSILVTTINLQRLNEFINDSNSITIYLDMFDAIKKARNQDALELFFKYNAPEDSLDKMIFHCKDKDDLSNIELLLMKYNATPTDQLLRSVINTSSVQDNSLEILELLLKNLKDKENIGRYPETINSLIWNTINSSSNQIYDITKLLIKYGAKVTKFDLISVKYCIDKANVNWRDIFELLLQNLEDDINKDEKVSDNLIYAIATIGNKNGENIFLDFTKLLVKYGAKVNKQNLENFVFLFSDGTPQPGHIKLFEFLLKNYSSAEVDKTAYYKESDRILFNAATYFTKDNGKFNELFKLLIVYSQNVKKEEFNYLAIDVCNKLAPLFNSKEIADTLIKEVTEIEQTDLSLLSNALNQDFDKEVITKRIYNKKKQECINNFSDMNGYFNEVINILNANNTKLINSGISIEQIMLIQDIFESVHKKFIHKNESALASLKKLTIEEAELIAYVEEDSALNTPFNTIFYSEKVQNIYSAFTESTYDTFEEFLNKEQNNLTKNEKTNITFYCKNKEYIEVGNFIINSLKTGTYDNEIVYLMTQYQQLASTIIKLSKIANYGYLSQDIYEHLKYITELYKERPQFDFASNHTFGTTNNSYDINYRSTNNYWSDEEGPDVLGHNNNNDF